MDVDIVKTSATESSVDTMAMMMMQMEKFPELLSEPFYNTTTTAAATAAAPILNVTPPCLIDQPPPSTDVINFPMMTSSSPLQQNNNSTSSGRYRMNQSNNNNCSSFAAMREMIFRIAVMQPIQIDAESIKAPKRRNVKISKDPQSVAARHRRERISERIRILQRLVPGGTKMDTASMLDEAVHYVKFLKKQVQTLEQAGANNNTPIGGSLFPAGMSSANVVNYSALFMKGCAQQPYHMLGSSSKQQLLS